MVSVLEPFQSSVIFNLMWSNCCIWCNISSVANLCANDTKASYICNDRVFILGPHCDMVAVAKGGTA